MELNHQIQTELPMEPCHHWRSISCLHYGGILVKNRAKDNLSCSLLCWILSMRPSLLTALHFGIASLQNHHHLSVGCTPLYGTQRYIDKDNLPCKLIKLSQIETGNHEKYFSIDILVLATIEHFHVLFFKEKEVMINIGYAIAACCAQWSYC